MTALNWGKGSLIREGDSDEWVCLLNRIWIQRWRYRSRHALDSIFRDNWLSGKTPSDRPRVKERYKENTELSAYFLLRLE